jgi:hypothetical protein
MILSDLLLSKKHTGNYFFFAADSEYFELYGKALALSLLEHAPWAKIHIHFYNQETSQAAWCNKKSITFTNEIVSKEHPEFKTLCACLRFIRIPEIFDDTARIIALDCDVIANNTIPEEKFLNDTEISRVNLKKGNRALASTLAYGSDNFRNLYRSRLLEAFLKDNIYWFLDQDILDQLVSEQQVSTMFLEWTGTKMSNDQMIWTAKGDRKHTKPQYMRLINQYLEKDKE